MKNAPQEQQPEPPAPPAAEPTAPARRYGDWEKAGRCIDF